jgi:GNAT superfamily N-acetyltransferase
VNGKFARDILFRAGDPADLATLLEIDLDASVLFERAGLFLDLPETHEFSVSERRNLRASLDAGTSLIAMDLRGQPVGFIALGLRDGLPYIEQISVRVSHMQRGIGSALLDTAFHTFASRRATALWLTTYDHLPWNREFYERNGFVRVPETGYGPDLRADLDFQRRWLPLPAQRVAMSRAPS